MLRATAVDPVTGHVLHGADEVAQPGVVRAPVAAVLPGAVVVGADGGHFLRRRDAIHFSFSHKCINI